MNTSNFVPLAAAVSLVLAGCGGGGGGSTAEPAPVATTPPPSASTTRAMQTTGPITNFGSVFVNGVRYDTSQATFRVDGRPATEAALRVGHIVTVRGRVDDDNENGIASDVYYDDIVTGPVDALDADAGMLVVLGQTVLVTETTSFDDDFEPDGLAAISIGQFVEVSGMFNANGDIVASRIEDEDDTDYEVHGFVSDLDDVAMTFVLNALLVDYSAATLDDFPNGMIENGDYVEAKGDALGANGELLADEVEYESILDRGDDDDDDDRDDDDDLFEIEGYITRFASADDFDVAGQPVRTTSDTEYDDGSAADLGLNIKVDVEGTLDADGVLIAEEIEFERERERDIRIEATVDSVDAATNTLVLLGVSVAVDASTRVEDKSDDDESSSFNVVDINAGDFVEVRGREGQAGGAAVTAVRLEREDDDEDDDDTVLQGFVVSVSEPGFEILGVTIETDANTEFDGRDDDDLSSSAFFAELMPGDLIKVKGVEVSDTTIVARDVEFETDD